ncbi:DUF3422 family protein [Acidocella sp.]|uniref:DUF3422 family protein n=1 Tax=Acidocella sp. TaxID=50710 RepID=UPI0026231768|nr:DUF3422 domain-containing protein [Acidocella sp.]
MTNPETARAMLALPEHKLRRALSAELHLRRFPRFGSPARVLQVVMVSDEAELSRDRAAAEDLCARFGVTPEPGKHFAAQLPGVYFVWERHAEFTSYSFICPGPVETLFDHDPLARLPADWVARIPGEVLRATHIVVLGPDTPAPDPETIARYFPDPDHVSCLVARGMARIWSEFRVHEDGVGRLLIHDHGLGAGDLARLVQQIQELGNYRNMALLGLPAAQAEGGALRDLEDKLAQVTAEIAETAVSNGEDERLLGDLTHLAGQLAHLKARTSYRMSATEAYGELVAERLKGLAPERIAGHPALTDFTERRLNPGLRTCRAFVRRLDDAASRTALASSLLRTRVETVMERQSRDLLASMNQRARLQLRLQQTVEGLSVVAISYYALALAGYVFHAVQELVPTLNATLMSALALPLIVGGVAWSIRRMTRRLH